MKKTTLLTLIIPIGVLLLTLLPQKKAERAFHTTTELAYFDQYLKVNEEGPGDGNVFIPIDSNVLFPTAKLCGGCHGYDPNHHALVSTSGVDVNIYDDWRSTMMANSARDPFWRAKVSHEILVNPAHSVELQDKCTSCHAPAGHYQAKLHDKQLHYSLLEAMTDSLALDGVTCQACHAQAPGNLGSLHSGALNFDTNYIRVAYGPYEMAFEPPMHTFVGITPKYSEHINDAGLCAGCHTLITGTVDYNGVSTGNTFVEQATYHEWLNSRYDQQHDNITCQGCHIPRLLDEIIISTNYQFLTPKFPFGLHEMAGANVSMLKLLRDNRTALGITATAPQFDSTIAATLRMLQQKTLDLSVSAGVTHGDTAYFDVLLKNKAGHKFPSGYPARRAWVEIEVTDAAGQTVFHSGKMAPDGSLIGENPNMEPHYDVIRAEDEVQIYELVPGDVSGLFTNVLERGDIALKDNRLTPQGFRLNDPVYDTTQIIGAALLDPDFNRSPGGIEGSGTDIVHLHIPVNGYTGALSVKAKVWYQSLPPKWMLPIFEYSSPEIDTFKNMLSQAENAPILISEALLADVPVSPVATEEIAQSEVIAIFPTITTDGRVQVTSGNPVRQVKVWNAAGQLVWNKPAYSIQLPAQRGIYWIEVQTRKGRKVQRVVRQ